MSIFGKPPDPNKPAEPCRPPAVPLPRRRRPAPARRRRPAGRPGVCVIGPKTTIKGEITGDEDLVIEGNVEGQIRITPRPAGRARRACSRPRWRPSPSP